MWTVIFLLIFVADNRQYITAVLIGIFADGIAEPVGNAFGARSRIAPETSAKLIRADQARTRRRP